jgi:hypothetical protein
MNYDLTFLVQPTVRAAEAGNYFKEALGLSVNTFLSVRMYIIWSCFIYNIKLNLRCDHHNDVQNSAKIIQEIWINR